MEDSKTIGLNLPPSELRHRIHWYGVANGHSVDAHHVRLGWLDLYESTSDRSEINLIVSPKDKVLR